MRLARPRTLAEALVPVVLEEVVPMLSVTCDVCDRSSPLSDFGNATEQLSLQFPNGWERRRPEGAGYHDFVELEHVCLRCVRREKREADAKAAGWKPPGPPDT